MIITSDKAVLSAHLSHNPEYFKILIGFFLWLHLHPIHVRTHLALRPELLPSLSFHYSVSGGSPKSHFQGLFCETPKCDRTNFAIILNLTLPSKDGGVSLSTNEAIVFGIITYILEDRI